MHSEDTKLSSKAIYFLAALCALAIIFAVCAGAAFSGIRKAQRAAARANIGYVHAVLLLAENSAQQNGHGAAPPSYKNMLKSYDNTQEGQLTAYEKYILAYILNTMGNNRDFDFTIYRYQDGFGIHTQIYYFPIRGRTDMRTDPYYLFSGEDLVLYNG